MAALLNLPAGCRLLELHARHNHQPTHAREHQGSAVRPSAAAVGYLDRARDGVGIGHEIGLHGLPPDCDLFRKTHGRPRKVTNSSLTCVPSWVTRQNSRYHRSASKAVTIGLVIISPAAVPLVPLGMQAADTFSP